MAFSKTVSITLTDESLASIPEICLVFGQTYEWWHRVLKASDLPTVGTKGHRKYRVVDVRNFYEQLTLVNPAVERMKSASSGADDSED